MTTARPRVLVLQPLFTIGAKLDYRMLGFQFWIADQLTAIGLEGASGIFRREDASDGPPEMIATHPPTDSDVRDVLVANEARYGVLASFAVLGGRPYLSSVRLFEARRGHPLRTLQRWKFEGEADDFPAAAHTVLVEIAKRLGFKLGPSTWDQLFGTSNSAAASSYFTALGCFAACDQGFVLDEPGPALRALVAAIAVGMPPAKNLLPHMVEALLSSGSAETDTVRAAVEAALDVAGEAPATWQPMLRRLGLAAPGLVN